MDACRAREAVRAANAAHLPILRKIAEPSLLPPGCDSTHSSPQAASRVGLRAHARFCTGLRA
eukprot:6795204-Alexandrium_andersonii.AAC.1